MPTTQPVPGARLQEIKQLRNNWHSGKYDYLIEPLIPKLLAYFENKYKGSQNEDKQDKSQAASSTSKDTMTGGGESGGTGNDEAGKQGEQGPKGEERKEGEEDAAADDIPNHKSG